MWAVKWTRKQVEFAADFSRSLSLLLLPASSADAILDGSRLVLDGFGIAWGVIFLLIGLWLTGKLGGGTV